MFPSRDPKEGCLDIFDIELNCIRIIEQESDQQHTSKSTSEWLKKQNKMRNLKVKVWPLNRVKMM